MLLKQEVELFTTRERSEEKHLLKLKSDLKYFFHHVVLDSLGIQKKFKYSKSFILQAAYAVDCISGNINRLAISIPPRNAKSTLWSVALPMWEWLTNPAHRFVQVSHSRGNLEQFQKDRQRILAHPDYSRIAEWKMTTDTTDEFYNSKGGHILSMVMVNVTTGLGGDTLIVDDPSPAGDGDDPKKLMKVWKKYITTLMSRLDDKENGRIIVVSQRIAVNDVVGNVVKAGYTYLKLQAIQDTDEEFKFPNSDRVWFRRQGDVLNEAHESLKVLLEIQSLDESSDTTVFQTQYQQEPSIEGNGVIQFAGIKKYSNLQEQYDKIVMSLDTASSIKERSANWSATIWGYYIENGKYCLDLIYSHAKKYEYPAGKRMVIDLIKSYNIEVIICENKSTGTALIPELKQFKVNRDLKEYKELKKHDYSVISITPVKDKESRAIMCAPFINAGRMRVPDTNQLPFTTGWMTKFNLEIRGFPNCPTRDILDTTTQVINHYGSTKKTSLKEFYNLKGYE